MVAGVVALRGCIALAPADGRGPGGIVYLCVCVAPARAERRHAAEASPSWYCRAGAARAAACRGRGVLDPAGG